MSFQELGESFAKVYYQAFDSNRASLMPLYTSESMLTFEGEQFVGAEAIVKKLTAMPVATVAHVITTIDCQPTTASGVLVFVVGQLKTDNDYPHGFSQAFHLVPSGPGNYTVLNDFFRLSLHHG
ncbi:Nuclear transport factor 2 [Acropora cervicornis]|uniref:Nuclear transport factor 2 n=1 Tax=Acropora cervicornis TaxID=6130 RepID=A0AAD9QIN9_ACRCE|nr:Nuclear transport factor 2 [Acropora cervicornis]